MGFLKRIGLTKTFLGAALPMLGKAVHDAIAKDYAGAFESLVQALAIMFIRDGIARK